MVHRVPAVVPAVFGLQGEAHGTGVHVLWPFCLWLLGLDVHHTAQSLQHAGDKYAFPPLQLFLRFLMVPITPLIMLRQKSTVGCIADHTRVNTFIASLLFNVLD